jgi:hypothetical protein
MDPKEAAMYFGVLVAADVTTAVAIHFVTGQLNALVVQAARAELQKLTMASLEAKQQSAPPSNSPNSSPHHQILTHLILFRLGYVTLMLTLMSLMFKEVHRSYFVQRI